MRSDAPVPRELPHDGHAALEPLPVAAPRQLLAARSMSASGRHAPVARGRLDLDVHEAVRERIQRGRRPARRSRALRPGGSGSRPRTPPCRAASGGPAALAGDDRERSAHRGVEADRVEDERGAGSQRGAGKRPEPAGQAAARAGHRLRTGSRPVAFAPAAPMRPAAARACSTSSGEAPFCGAKVRAAPSGPHIGMRTSQASESFTPRRVRRSSRRSAVRDREVRSQRLQRSAAAVGRGAAADGDHDLARAGVDGGRISSPVPRLEAATASRSSARRRHSPDAWACSTTATRPPSSSANAARPRARARRSRGRPGSGRRGAARSPPSCPPRRRRPAAARRPRRRPPAARGRSPPPPRRHRACP